MKLLAQHTTGPDFNIDVPGPYIGLQNLRPSQYATTIVNLLLGAAGVLSFIFLLWGGLQWITAGGDKDAIEKARRKILQSLIGLAIVFSAYAIMYIIRVTFQINVIQIRFRPLGTP